MLNITRAFNKITLNQCCLSHCSETSGAIRLLHTSKILFDTTDTTVQDPKPTPQKRWKRVEPVVDWLPFPWERRAKFNIFEQSGDKVTTLICDPSLPKPDFEHSDELKTANESVKRMFTVATASIPEVKEVCKRELIKRVQRHPMDFDSLEVQIAERTIQIRGLFDHKAKKGRREVRISRVILPILIQRRNGLLNQLRNLDNDRFLWLLEELQLYFEPPKLSYPSVFYCRKNDLRQLTKEYHDNLIAQKKAAYHEELKKQQELFLEEKKEVLAWIEAEEKAIKALNV